MTRKLRRKDLKQPDEFVTLTQRAVEYARENERQVTLGTLGIVLLVALALGVRTYRDWQAESSREAFADAYRRFAAGELERAVEGFRYVRANWSNTPSGELAAIYAGSALIELGKLDDARVAFGEVADTTDEPSLRQIALYNLGLLHRRTGSVEEAERQLQSAADIDGPLRGAAWLAARTTGGEVAEAIPDGVSEDVREFLKVKRAR
ncbi:MAG: tetratricopeptide repeat protein [bacterium]